MSLFNIKLYLFKIKETPIQSYDAGIHEYKDVNI